MTNNLNINALELRKKLTPQNLINYRVYYIGKDGIQVGGNPISGRFQWGNIHELARGILRAWARDIFAEHHAGQISTILQRWAKDWTGTHDIEDADATSTELSTTERLLSWLRDQSIDRKRYFGQHYNNRDASIMYHLSKEMVEAVSYRLKRLGMKPNIQWEVESLPDCVGIYRILLEGGKNHES